MRKHLMMIVCLMAFAITANAGDGEGRLSVAAGFQFPETLDAQIGYERDLGYGNVVEIYGEIGDHWQHPTCHMFWKGYYWSGAMSYKHRIHRYKNSILKIRGGVDFGADQRRFFMGIEAGFEWDYVFPCGIRFTIIQKNNVNFFHGDTFRNGLLVGFKFPL